MAEYKYDPTAMTDSAYHMSNFNEYDFEPQRGNNFEVVITGLDTLVTPKKGTKIAGASEVIRLACAGSGTPGFNVDTLKIRRGNTEVKFAGQVTYEDTEIKLNDFIGKDTEKVLNAWHSLVFNPHTQNIGKASQYKKSAFLYEYSPDHAIVRSWELKGCWLSKVNYGDYASDNSGNRQCTATLVYDWAELQE